MKDIKERKDLELLVGEFYKKVLTDDKIAPYLSGKYNLIGQATFLLFVIFGRTYFGEGKNTKPI